MSDAAVNFLAVCKDDSTEQVNRKVTDGKGPWTSQCRGSRRRIQQKPALQSRIRGLASQLQF